MTESPRRRFPQWVKSKLLVLVSGCCLTLVVLSSLLLLVCDAGQLCASCSDIGKPDDCHRHLRCDADEKCFIRRYASDSGAILYGLGCISSQACQFFQQPIIGKRQAGRHLKCLSCCNDTALCNQDSDCNDSVTELPTCAFCNKVSDPANCRHSVNCDQEEKCYTHKFINGSGATYYELGCTPSELCRSPLRVISVKRDDYYHLSCATCCDNGSMCNQHSACSPNISTSTVKHTTRTPTTQKTSLKARDCSGLQGTGQHNGTYTIYPYGPSGAGVPVYCEYNTDGVRTIEQKSIANFSLLGGDRQTKALQVDRTLFPIPTVIQRRIDSSVDFGRNWTEYKEGFGNVAGEYWLGNDALHEITSHGHYTMKVVLTDWTRVTKVAEYSTFRIGSESDGYRLTLQGYSGDAGDSMAYNDGRLFSTTDRDNDGRYGTNCAEDYGRGGWWYHGKFWYKWCTDANLNGVYHHTPSAPDVTGIFWSDWHFFDSLKATTIMIRKT